MKIGIITGNLGETRTGIDNYIYNLINQIKKDHDVTIIRPPAGIDIPGCDTIVIKCPLIQRYNSVAFGQSLRFYKKEFEGFDIIHNPGQFLTFPKPGRKNVITVHDITPVLFPEYHFQFRTITNRILLPQVMKKADLIITVSGNTKQDIISKYHLNPKKIKVVYKSVDSQYRPLDNNNVMPWLKDKGLLKPYLLFVGTIEPRKNIQTVISVFEYIADSDPDIELVIAGKKGWRSENIFQRMYSSNHADRIKYMNYISFEELPYLYNGAVSLIFPSWYEGFGLPPLEAMSCGTPVLCSNTSSLPEVMGDFGIMKNPDDIFGFTDEIYHILNDGNYRDKIISYGLKRSAEFSWEKTAMETITLYKQVLGE